MDIKIIKEPNSKPERKFIHKELAAGRWFKLSFEEQLGNIGRAIARAREVFCDAISGGREYKSSLEDLERYFGQFAYAARVKI